MLPREMSAGKRLAVAKLTVQALNWKEMKSLTFMQGNANYTDLNEQKFK